MGFLKDFFQMVNSQTIKAYRNKQNLTQEAFAERIGMSEQTVLNWENGKKIPKTKMALLESIINEDGDMRRSVDYTADAEVSIPYYDIDVTAGHLSGFNDFAQEPQERYSIPALRDCTAIFPIYGDSMYPRYRSGDRVIVKKYLHFRDYIRYGEVYMIFTSNDERMIKIIKKCAKDGCLLLSSVNESYDDFEIPLDVVTDLFLVKGKLSIENE